MEESAPNASHSDSGAKYDKDRNKLAGHLKDMLWRLEAETNLAAQRDPSKFQLLGSLTTGLHWSVLGTSRRGYISFLTLHEKVSVPDTRRGMSGLTDAMRLVMRVHNFL